MSSFQNILKMLAYDIPKKSIIFELRRKNIIQFDNIRYFLNIENKTPFIKKNIKEFCEIYID